MPQLNKMMIRTFRNSKQVLWFKHYQTFLINYSAWAKQYKPASLLRFTGQISVGKFI